jgi:c-di-GMP-binding flagellar brake protein YcgR
MADERRKFERISIPASAKIRAENSKGKTVGPVRMLGRGGLMVDTQESFEIGGKMNLVIVDEAEGIHRTVSVVPRYRQGQGVGFEFHHLDADAAVEIGVIIGRHYAHPDKK